MISVVLYAHYQMIKLIPNSDLLSLDKTPDFHLKGHRFNI